jgi:hypothetical protein
VLSSRGGSGLELLLRLMAGLQELLLSGLPLLGL